MQENSTKALQWKQTRRKFNVTDMKAAEECTMTLKRTTGFLVMKGLEGRDWYDWTWFCKADFDCSVDTDLKEGQSGVELGGS